jgi:hypothetical protein
MRGKPASNRQVAICSLSTHCLAFTHYKRRGTVIYLSPAHEPAYDLNASLAAAVKIRLLALKNALPS